MEADKDQTLKEKDHRAVSQEESSGTVSTSVTADSKN